MPINIVTVLNPHPNPVLTETQRQLVNESIKDPREISVSAIREVLKGSSNIIDLNDSNHTGTEGSLIDLIV